MENLKDFHTWKLTTSAEHGKIDDFRYFVRCLRSTEQPDLLIYPVYVSGANDIDPEDPVSATNPAMTRPADNPTPCISALRYFIRTGAGAQKSIYNCDTKSIPATFMAAGPPLLTNPEWYNAKNTFGGFFCRLEALHLIESGKNPLKTRRKQVLKIRKKFHLTHYTKE